MVLRGPALIALDDAHRADRASMRLTAHIGRRLARLPLLLVLTRRDRPARGELDLLLADLAGVACGSPNWTSDRSPTGKSWRFPRPATGFCPPP
jgi:hypothetical protein